MVFDKSYENTTKKYRQTPHGAKSHRKSEWTRKGKIKFYNFDETYDKYINARNCEICNISLTDDKKTTASRRCLEHDHISGYVRSVCCSKCNNKIAGVDKTRYILLLEIHRKVDKDN